MLQLAVSPKTVQTVIDQIIFTCPIPTSKLLPKCPLLLVRLFLYLLGKLYQIRTSFGKQLFLSFCSGN